MLKCSRCDEKAVYIRRYSGQNFCREHFLEYFEKKVVGTVRKGRMVERGERVALAISGGKDSLTLAYLMKKLEKKLDLELYCILVDEGIKGYREKTVEAAKEFCRELNLELEVVSFRQEYSKTLDEMVEIGERTPCTYCGVFRRELLNSKALELGADKLATGHNLDDEVQAILMNYIKGDVERLIKIGSTSGKLGLVARVKPLMEMPEKEVALFSLLKGFPSSFEECPYATSFRVKIRDIINNLEESSPGIKFSILRGYQKLFQNFKSLEVVPLKKCRLCSNTTSQEVCMSCRLREELGLG